MTTNAYLARTTEDFRKKKIQKCHVQQEQSTAKCCANKQRLLRPVAAAASTMLGFPQKTRARKKTYLPEREANGCCIERSSGTKKRNPCSRNKILGFFALQNASH